MGNRYTHAPRFPRGGPNVRVNLTPAQLDDLRARAAAAGVPLATYVRAVLWPRETTADRDLLA